MGTPVDSSLDLIRYAREQMTQLKSEYKDSLKHQQISPRVQMQVKNILENLRSSLDYLAGYAVKKYGETGKGSPQFPIVDDPQDFIKVEPRYIRGLREGNFTILEIIEQSQPYNPGMEWLLVLTKSVNPMKHTDFAPQVRTETKGLRVTGQGSTIQWDPSRVTFGSGVRMNGHNVDPRFQRPMTTSVERIVYVDWLFADTGRSVMGTLEKLHEGVRSIHTHLAPHLQ